MARITLDIFSGRPNPVWDLEDGQAQQILREIEAHQDLVGDTRATSGRLGFRGLVVEGAGTGRGLPGNFRVTGDNPRGVELALRLLDRLGTPHGTHDVPPALGLGRVEDLDLHHLIVEDAQTRTFEASGTQADSVSLLALNPAPVLGTDASSWSTIAQGSCSIEVAAFNPGFWNTAAYQTLNNCYNYATNRRTDTFAQPGRAAGAQATRMRCANVTTGAVADGAHQEPNCVIGEEPRWYMALVIWPNIDYHWYRKQAEGYWGHKPGQTAARNVDNSNNVIFNPETADRGGYRDFCGYFFARSGMGIR